MARALLNTLNEPQLSERKNSHELRWERMTEVKCKGVASHPTFGYPESLVSQTWHSMACWS